ncbi:MAG: cyclic nucleotide-binding domain-containing protein [Gammaproteobacteria bacterium]|jgi:CRP-like cAMP-binding protein
MNQPSFFHDLSVSDIGEVRAHSEVRRFSGGDLVFMEGDPVDHFYIIESGRISIYLRRAGRDELLCELESGEYFGEMAIFNRDRRAASARATVETELICVDKDWFLGFVEARPAVAGRIRALLERRNEEILLTESLIDSTGIDSQRLHVSIKGDPSMRESAFSRERYESIVDRHLEQLQPVLEELLLKRSVYRLFLNFSSGELRVSSIFDPFIEEIHTVDKLILGSYVDRHFPLIPYAEKSNMVRAIYGFIIQDGHFAGLPGQWQKIYINTRGRWTPVRQEEISKVIARLGVLRSMPNFYLRNFSISMIKDAIRMQFNCDGTHIVNALDYQRFLEENLG